ncbi:MAG: lipid II flippase MurJ [Candidatus Peribacteraceae bacterium]|nr:lipid II flippase MurJ [Candidatus Peribacteraceae bacterium]
MRKLLRSLLSQDRIAGGAFVLALTGLLASVCGFLRDQAFSIMFPLDKDPLGVASVYIAAFRPSDLLFQIFVMSCLSVVVVPFLAGHLAHGRKREMDRIVTSTMLLFGIAFGIAALVLAIFFPAVAPKLVKFEGPTLALYIRFGRIALLTNFLFVFGNAIGQYLIAKQRYWVYGLTPIVWALCTIGGIYFLSGPLGPMGPIVGTLIGTVIYVLWRSIAVVQSGFRPELAGMNLIHDELWQMGWLIIPRMAALGALQLQLLLLDRLASGLETKVVALNQFARNFESVIPGIVGIAIAQSVFSLLGQYAALGDGIRFRRCMKKGILMNLALSIPGAVCLAVCAGIAAWLMRLDASVTPMFISSLLIYAVAVPFESLNHIILRSFYSLKNTGWPAVTSVVSCIVAVGTGTVLLPSLGLYALAIAFVGGQVVQTVLLSIALKALLRQRIGGSGQGVGAIEMEMA